MGTYFVYIIKSVNGLHYIGQTNNLSHRIYRHNHNRNKYTKGKGPWKLVISCEVNSRSEAIHLESYLKKLKDSQKAIDYLERMKMKQTGSRQVHSAPDKSDMTS